MRQLSRRYSKPGEMHSMNMTVGGSEGRLDHSDDFDYLRVQSVQRLAEAKV